MTEEKTEGKLVLIIGPSGVGKSVILNALKEKHPELHFPRSATTRQRRKGESDDLYHFVRDEEFDALIEEGNVLEWAVVHESDRYGTLRDEIVPHIKNGTTVVREVDVQGFESIRKHALFDGEAAPHTLLSLFILPESKEQLITHITERAPIAKEELQRRIESMEEELCYADKCDVQIVNREGKLEETLKEVEGVVCE